MTAQEKNQLYKGSFFKKGMNLNLASPIPIEKTVTFR